MTVLFSEVEYLVIRTKVMRMTVKDSLEYLRDEGFKVGRTQYYQILSQIDLISNQRKYDLMGKGLWQQHLQRIEQLETILDLSWVNFKTEVDPSKKQKILESIAVLQPMLSKYYEETQYTIEFDAKRLERNNLQSERPRLNLLKDSNK